MGGKSLPHRDSITDRPAPSQSLYRLNYPAHVFRVVLCMKLLLPPVCYMSYPSEASFFCYRKNIPWRTSDDGTLMSTLSLNFVIFSGPPITPPTHPPPPLTTSSHLKLFTKYGLKALHDNCVMETAIYVNFFIYRASEFFRKKFYGMHYHFASLYGFILIDDMMYTFRNFCAARHVSSDTCPHSALFHCDGQ